MGVPTAEGFPKDRRLRRRREFVRVQHNGIKTRTKAFVGLALVRDAGPVRLGITTSRHVGNAVTRNRIRRLVREIFRKGKMALPTRTDIVIIALRRAAGLDSAQTVRDLARLGEQLCQKVEQER
jgi:ribonuclease P protein component